VLSLKFGFSGEPENVVVLVALISLAFSYLGTLLFAPLAYLLLRAIKQTAFWPSPIAGFVGGVGMMCIFFVVLPLSLGHDLTLIFARFDYGLFKEAVEFGGLPGGAVGSLLWLIARPDRQQRSAE
jgi:hypothetical protein